MTTGREAVLLSWSGGKDSALALARLQEDAAIEVTGLLTTVTAGYDRISIHGVRRTLLHRQADELGLDVHEIMIQSQCSNESYELAWSDALARLRETVSGAKRIAFGDIFLTDVREYREAMARSLGFGAVFPLWGESTRSLADEVIGRRILARVVCVDTEVLPAGFAGRAYDTGFLESLPPAIDPCGERGEFHTFVSWSPGFRAPVQYAIGETVLREERFAYCDLLASPDSTNRNHGGPDASAATHCRD